MAKRKSVLFVWRTAIIQSRMKVMRRVVLMGFAEHMNAARGDSCWPSDKTVGLEIGYSRQTVNSHKKKAIRDGWLLQRPRGERARSGVSVYEYHAYLPEGHPAWRDLSDDDAAYLERTATEWRSAMEQESESAARVGKVEETRQSEQVEAPAIADGGGQATPSGLSTTTDSLPVNDQEPACQRRDRQPVNGGTIEPVKDGGQAESRKAKQGNDQGSSPTESSAKRGSHGGSHSYGGSTRGRAQAGDPVPLADRSLGSRQVPALPGPGADGYFRCTKGCGSIVGGPRVTCARCRVAAAEAAS